MFGTALNVEIRSHEYRKDKMESQQDHIANRSPDPLVLLVDLGFLGILRPSAGLHQGRQREFSITSVAENLSNLDHCQCLHGEFMLNPP